MNTNIYIYIHMCICKYDCVYSMTCERLKVCWFQIPNLDTHTHTPKCIHWALSVDYLRFISLSAYVWKKNLWKLGDDRLG